MRIALSNIAWDASEDELVAALLAKYGIDAIDVAPGKYFHDVQNVIPADVDRVRDRWGGRGIHVTGMQALLFGTTGLNLFGCTGAQAAMFDHLTAVCRIASRLGATRLVFGSPRNRDRGALSDAEARAIAVPFFRRLGDVAGDHGVAFCLEPNPSRYGANFMIDSTETAAIVTEIAHRAIRMQLDTGALTINGEDPFQVIGTYAALIGHVHASEPDLVTLGDGGTDHAGVAAALLEHVPDQLVSIEMLPAKHESNMSAIERAIRTAIQFYRDPTGRGISA
jgi:D-psicose/D-tagatose/L-ribulose 3-epimerase